MNNWVILAQIFLVAILVALVFILWIEVQSKDLEILIVELKYKTLLDMYKALKNTDFTKTGKYEHFCRTENSKVIEKPLIIRDFE